LRAALQKGEVMGHCQEHVSAGETVRQASACYTNNKNRMRFRDIEPGLQIGHHTVKSLEPDAGRQG